MEHVAERLEFVGVPVPIKDAEGRFIGGRLVDNPFRERTVDGQRCDGCGVGEGIHHHAACPVVRGAIHGQGGHLAGIPVESVLADAAHGDVVRDAFAERREDEVGRCTVCRANYTEVCDRVAHARFGAYDLRCAVSVNTAKCDGVTDDRDAIERAVAIAQTWGAETIADVPVALTIRQSTPDIDIGKVASEIQRWAARHGVPISDASAKVSAENVRKMLTERIKPDRDYAVQIGPLPGAIRNYAPMCRRIAIRDAVLAIAGVSRCEVNDHGPAASRSMIVAVWADVATRMHDVLAAVEERADGMPFEVKVRLQRAVFQYDTQNASAAVRPTDDMRAGDAVMTSEEWSAAVRQRLAGRAQAAVTVVQTEADADIDNFADAP